MDGFVWRSETVLNIPRVPKLLLRINTTKEKLLCGGAEILILGFIWILVFEFWVLGFSNIEQILLV
jgi:hypothetical protein